MQYQNSKPKIHTQIHTRRGGNKILIKKKKKDKKGEREESGEWKWEEEQIERGRLGGICGERNEDKRIKKIKKKI